MPDLVMLLDLQRARRTVPAPLVVVPHQDQYELRERVDLVPAYPSVSTSTALLIRVGHTETSAMLMPNWDQHKLC
eukprot:2210522-Rhodomonas_salina.5